MSKPTADNILTAELVKTIDTVCSEPLIIGCDNNEENYATGTLYRCKLWYGDLGDDECRKMVRWPREDCCLEVASLAGVKQSNGQNTHIDLVHAGLLCAHHRMNPTNDNAGGWPASEMRSWLYNRYLSGLPETLRAMLLKVRVASVGHVDGENAEILDSVDLVYLPSYREMGGGLRDQEPYVYCGEWIPWYTSDRLRIKFTGTTLPYQRTFTLSKIPPSAPSVGDIWINDNDGDRKNVGYLWGGNVWLLARWYWLRDSSVASSAYFANVNFCGFVIFGGYFAATSNGVLPRLHI